MNSTLKKWERRQIYRSLILLAKGLENELVTVDLRNETSVSGLLENVDNYMNMEFLDAALVEYDGTYKYFPSLFLPCRMVRDIIIPSHKPISTTINSLLPRPTVTRAPRKKPMTLKRSRALRQQEETKRLVQNILEERKISTNTGNNSTSANQ